jgi:glutamyl-Q tRNA(Asp) synthetase
MNSPMRSSKTWRGWGSIGTVRSAGNRSISPIIGRPSIERAGGAPQGELGPTYPGICRRLGAAERAVRRATAASYAVRLDVAAVLERTGPLTWSEDGRRVAAEPLALGDVVLARKEIATSYHLAVTVDDALQGVTLVTRGVDLFAATHIHRLLQALLGLPTPLYRHHPLLTDAHGRRLAKRDQALTVRAMRAAGLTAAAVLRAARGD